MPTETEIIAALQFTLSGLNDPAINTSSDPVYSFTYQFETSDPADLPTSTTYTGWTALSVAEKTTIRTALDHIETILNVDFTEVSGNPDPDINFGKVALSGFTGYGGYSYSWNGSNELTAYDGYSVFKNSVDISTRIDLILHEMGHALANKHPFSGAVTLPSEFDTNKYTIMSYTANPDNGLDGNVLQLYDILALQARWGANTDTNSGGTTYTGPRSTTVDAIWDAGGTDWLDASAKSTSVMLNLNAGSFSQFGAYEDVAIAYGVRMEHARGGSDDDVVIGNQYRNKLYGNDGHDDLYGGSGKDDLIGGRGNDFLDGGDRNDLLKGGKGSDFLLGGNNLDVLSGGTGKDILNGEKGDDTLEGNAGRDTFVFARGGDSDIILDFEDNIDRVLFDVAEFHTRSLIRALATQDGDDVVYDFGQGDVLRILNSHVSLMEDDVGIL